MKENRLAQFGNIPVSASMISSLYLGIKAKNNKVSELEKTDDIMLRFP